MVLRSRTPFARFLVQTIKAPRSALASAPSLFPVPVLFGDHLGRMPPSCNRRQRARIHLARATHAIVMALNYVHCGSSIDFSLLGRELSPLHYRVYRNVSSFLKTEVSTEPFLVPSAGRRFPQLDARLNELSSVVANLGLSGSPYSRAFPGTEVPADNSICDELEPYRSLDASRLSLVGRGHWDCSSFLDDGLILPFRDPNFLLTDRVPGFGDAPCLNDRPEEVAALAKKWDQQGLLYLHKEPVIQHHRVKVFNCFKSKEKDRQIGDRRGRNFSEQALKGPSSWLPTGPVFCQLFVCPRSQKLSISISDRKDYYHQVQVTRQRALANTVGPAVPEALVQSTEAYSAFVLRKVKRKLDRSVKGDDLDSKAPRALPSDSLVNVSFSSIFQGDHAGVEFATSAHEGLLLCAGCLSPRSRMVSSRPLFDAQHAQGLVIDDYFALSVEPIDMPAADTWSKHLLTKASSVYKSFGILGSIEKDVVASRQAKVVGAAINNGVDAVKQNMTTVASPAQKRLALSWISLQIASLRWTSDSLHSCLMGGWVSALLYRRPLMSVVQHAFSLVDHRQMDSSRPKLLSLPRSIADELVLLSVLCPLASTDISADFHPEVFATDSSKDKGAIVSAPISRSKAMMLHRACVSKGSYTRLIPKSTALLKVLGLEVEQLEEEATLCATASVPKPMAYSFDFLEIFAGSARVTAAVAARGISVGPPIDLSRSPEHDMRSSLIMRWLSHLIVECLIRAFMIEPVCTTFSIMRRPALRSKEQPLGFDVLDPQTLTGNQLALRSLQSMDLADRHSVAALLENPFTSKIRYLPSWKHVEALPSVSLCRCDSCRFGSPHLKSFRFLGAHLDLAPLSLRCKCSTKHLQIQGALTKRSAVYTEELADALSAVFEKAILAKRKQDEDFDCIHSEGHENLLVNDVARSSHWKLVSSWTFRKQSHINLQELAAILRLIYKLASSRFSSRVSILVDSLVCRGAMSKGRSSSRAIAALLRRCTAALLAANLYVITPFCPTRLNVADDPTRDHPIRDPVVSVIDESWKDKDVYKLANHPRLCRWAANWAMLVLRLIGPKALDFADRSVFFCPRAVCPVRGTVVQMDFDNTLGFPGEGPLASSACWSACSAYPSFVQLDFDSTLGFPGEGPPVLGGRSHFACFTEPGCLLLMLVVWTYHSHLGASAMPLRPQTANDYQRAGIRSTAPLTEGRRVLPQTSSLRSHLYSAFLRWTVDEGLNWDEMLSVSHAHIDEINSVIISYGRALYAAGRPYLHYVETINALASARPSLRRQLQGAWSLAFGWLQQEPGLHHTSMPPQVLLALLTTSLLWGWLRVAGCLALGWGALLRAGELVSSTRRQLLLPSDVYGTLDHALLTILEPKTRFTAAKHQCAKLDAPDLLFLVQLAFGNLQKHQKLWPLSAQTLRQRLKALMKALKLPLEKSSTHRCLDLGSLRAGGATWILNTTENAELTRRRGRWINAKTMEIYVQEVSSATFLLDLDQSTRESIVYLASLFPQVLQRTKFFLDSHIPESSWPYLSFPAGSDIRGQRV